MAKGPIARLEILVGSLMQTRDLSARVYFFPGASVQCGSSIVNPLSKKLVKCVEIRIKFRKFQNQFFGFMVENTTTFVILTWSDSEYF
jgi:hypothetical protein